MCFTDAPVSMSEIECLLANLPCIKHLELHAEGSDELADGRRWQMLTSCLNTFHFNCHVTLVNIAEALNSFRTPFWIHKKRWFVAYYNGWLFSVPHFGNTHRSAFEWIGLHTTAYENSVISECITTLSLKTNPTMTHQRFNHVHNLEINDSISRRILRKLSI